MHVPADKIACASSDSQGQGPLNFHNLSLNFFLDTFIKSTLQYCFQIVINFVILGLIDAFIILRVKPFILTDFTVTLSRIPVMFSFKTRKRSSY